MSKKYKCSYQEERINDYSFLIAPTRVMNRRRGRIENHNKNNKRLRDILERLGLNKPEVVNE